MKVRLDVTVLRIASRFVAVTELGGLTVRGTPANTAIGAYRGLLWKLSGNGPQDDDADLGVHMLLENTSLQAEMEHQALPPAGSSSAPSAAPENEQAAMAWMKAHPGHSYQQYLDEQEKELWPHETPRGYRPTTPGAGA